MPDSIDVGPSFALQAVDEGIWDPYKPTTWDEIPDNLKDPDGNWVGAYYGIMSVGVNTTLVENVADLVRRSQRPAVRRPGGAQRRSP